MPDFIAVCVPAEIRQREKSAQRRGRRTLDFGDVEESSRAADESSAGEGELGDRLIASLVERPSAVRDAFTAFEDFGEERVVLESLRRGVRVSCESLEMTKRGAHLKLLEGADVGVGVVEADDDTEGDHLVLHVVEPSSSVGRVVERPAERVLDRAGVVVLLLDLPNLLDAESVRLNVLAIPKPQARDDLLRETAVRSLGEQGDLGVELHAGLERVDRKSVV